MKSGKCPKCKQRNISSIRSRQDFRLAGGPTSYDVPHPESATVTYGCGDCLYTETYLDDTKHQKSLETYLGWERVSAPASGPFR